MGFEQVDDHTFIKDFSGILKLECCMYDKKHRPSTYEWQLDEENLKRAVIELKKMKKYIDDNVSRLEKEMKGYDTNFLLIWHDTHVLWNCTKKYRDKLFSVASQLTAQKEYFLEKYDAFLNVVFKGTSENGYYCLSQ